MCFSSSNALQIWKQDGLHVVENKCFCERAYILDVFVNAMITIQEMSCESP